MTDITEKVIPWIVLVTCDVCHPLLRRNWYCILRLESFYFCNTLLTLNPVKEEAREIDVLPDLKHNSLISVSKLSDAGYITVLQPNDGGVSVYWTDVIVIHVKKEAVLQGWRDDTGLWCIPLKEHVVNKNTDTLLLQRPVPVDTVNNVYELASIEKTVRYLHAALGFPTKATMLKAIRNKWLLGWPQLTVSAVNEYIPESEETPKGHI